MNGKNHVTSVFVTERASEMLLGWSETGGLVWRTCGTCGIEMYLQGQRPHGNPRCKFEMILNWF